TTPPALQSRAPGTAQLLAEGPGKLRRAPLPVVGEPTRPAPPSGQDRAVVAILVPGDAETARLADAAETAGHPVFRIETTPETLGAEFFRWEVATAVAGAALGINPVDEPDVPRAKQRTPAQPAHQLGTRAGRAS